MSDRARNRKIDEHPALPNRPAMTSVENVTWALVAETRLGKHGQLCPVWTKRAPLDLCDCWILREAQRDAQTALDAAAAWQRAESGGQVTA